MIITYSGHGDEGGSLVFVDGKQYVEYLAFLAELHPNQRKHAHERLNQQPKILPVQERVGFNDRNNNFILIQKYIRANNIELSAFGGIMMPVGAFSRMFSILICLRFPIIRNEISH